MKFLHYTFLAFLLISISCSLTLGQKKKTETDDPYQKYVIALPVVDKVEIFAVKGLPPAAQKNADCTNPDIICNKYPVRVLARKTLSGENASKISSLWRNLRSGNGAGCFGGVYVLRFYHKDKVLLTTDICFHCCNITLPGENGGSDIVSMCGNEDASSQFKDFLINELPFPKPNDKE